MMGFPTGDRFKGIAEQKSKLESQFKRKAEFMTKNKTPIWNGEFGYIDLFRKPTPKVLTFPDPSTRTLNSTPMPKSSIKSVTTC